MRSEQIFNTFPKERPRLPTEFAAIYLKHYQNSREGKTKTLGIVKGMEGWMHKRVAEDMASAPQRSTLEIGAGTLNHLPYETSPACYDIVEPFRELYESSPNLRQVRHVYHDISEIGRAKRYERIISVATFEHICNLPEVVARSGLLLTGEGQLRVAIPSEGTLLWRLGWTFITGVEFRLRYNLNYGVLMRHEHVNTAREIEEVLGYFFSEVKGSVFGLAKSLSFYQFYECSKPRLEKCTNYLTSLEQSLSELQ